MFLYMDTSALVKKYFKEEGTSGVVSLSVFPEIQ
jgi:hypothetical protein